MNLFLIGYRGSGKTSVAKLLARTLGRTWFDSDDLVESKAGQSIATLFSEQGEAAFRDLESQAVTELAQRTDAIVALGGGAVLRFENRAAIRKAGKVVWLRASVDTLWQRISADPATAARRPALTAQAGREEISALLAAREALYRESSDLSVDTEGKTAREVAAEILSRLKLV